MCLSDEPKTLWSSDRGLQLWRYGVGHLQLSLRTPWSDDYPDVVRLAFSSVLRVELSTHYRGPVRLLLVDRHGPYPEALSRPAKLVEIHGADAEGFLAAGTMRITRETREGTVLEVLVSENMSSEW